MIEKLFEHIVCDLQVDTGFVKNKSDQLHRSTHISFHPGLACTKFLFQVLFLFLEFSKKTTISKKNFESKKKL